MYLFNLESGSIYWQCHIFIAENIPMLAVTVGRDVGMHVRGSSVCVGVDLFVKVRRVYVCVIDRVQYHHMNCIRFLVNVLLWWSRL